MKIKSVGIENYKSYKDFTVVDLGVTSEGQNTCLIGALNGGGKTSFVESIKIALFGASKKEIYKNFNRAKSHETNKFTKFELKILEEDKEIKISRTFRGKNCKIHNDLSESIEVFIDGVDIFNGDKVKSQKYISKLIPQEITEFFIFDGEKVKTLASDKDLSVLKKSYEGVLGIARIDVLIKNLEDIKKDYIKKKFNYNQHEIAEAQLEATKLKSSIHDLKIRKQELIDENTSNKVAYQEINEAYEKLLTSNKSNENEYKELDESRKNADKKLKACVVQNTLILNSLSILLLRPYFKELINELDLQNDDTVNLSIVNNAEKISARLISAIEEPKPIWNERLGNERKAELEARITKVLSCFGKSSNSKIHPVSSADVNSLIELIRQNLKFNFDHTLPSFHNVDRHIQELKTIEYNIALLQEDSDDTAELLRIKSERDDCYTKYTNTTKELDDVRAQLIAYEKNANKIQSEIDSMVSRQNQYDEIVCKINKVNLYISKLNRFKNYLRDNKILTLEAKSFEMYQLLSHREGCSSISINPNSFEIKVRDIKGSEIDKKELAEGEKQVLAMSILWGLSQTSNIKFPMIIDTPLSKLDSHHRKNIVKYFYSTAAEQVVILSTDTEIQGKLYDIMSSYTCKQMILAFCVEELATTVKEDNYITNYA